MDKRETNCYSEIAESIAIMQPYFLPYMGYFHLIKAVDIFIIYDDVNYINKGYINRNSILVNQQPHKITLSLLGVSQNKLINEIEIGNNATKLLKTIEMAYKKAPFFNDIFLILNNIFSNKEKNLAKFIGHSLQVIAHSLGLKTNFLYSSEIEKNNALTAQYKIIEICKKLSAKKYINAVGGQQLYDQATFKKENIDLFFIKSRLQPYKQFKNTFVPYLSIIDTMMFNDNFHILKMLEQYELFSGC